MTTDELVVELRRAVMWSMTRAMLGEVTPSLQTVAVKVAEREIAIRFAFTDPTTVSPRDRRDALSMAERIRARVSEAVPAQITTEVTFIDPEADRRRRRDHYVDEGPRSTFLMFERSPTSGDLRG